MEQVKRMLKCAGENLKKAQARYQKNYDAYIRPPAK